MPTPRVTIQDWSSGMVTDTTRDAGFATLYCVDIHSNPGVLRVNPRLEADDDTAVSSNSDIIKWFETYDENAGSSSTTIYGYGEQGYIYYRTGGTWTEVRNITVNADGQGLKHFQTSLYFSTRQGIGKVTGDPTVGGNWNDTFQAFTTTIPASTSDAPLSYGPMEQFAGSLFVGNTRYVSKLEADETTWTPEALTLPTGYRIVSMVEWNDRLVISTNSGNDVEEEIIVFWDGVSEFPELTIKVPKPGISALFNHNNVLRGFLNNKMYVFTGTDFEIAFQLPKMGTTNDQLVVQVYPGAVELYKERMIFGAWQNNDTTTGFLSGVYGYGRHSVKYPNALSFEFEASTENNGRLEIGAVKVFGGNDGNPIVYVSYHDVDNAEYVVDRLDPSQFYIDRAYILTNAYELPSAEFGKVIKGTRIEFDGPLDTTRTVDRVDVSYRTDLDINYNDDTTNFTTLGEIDNDSTNGNDNQEEILYGVYERPRRIQFKYDLLNDTSSGGDMGITKINIY